MRNVCAWGGGGSLVLGLLLAIPAAAAEPAAQSKKDSGVQRMEIFNSSTRTVQYFADGLSTSDRAALRDLERAENNMGLADQLLALRTQYVRNQRMLEDQRSMAQAQLLIASPGYAPGVYPDQVREVDANLALALGSRGFYTGLHSGVYPVGYPTGAYFAGSYMGFPGYASLPYLNGTAGAANTRTIATVLDDGPLITQLAQTLATQATPEFAAQALRARDTVMARAGSSDRLREMLDLPKGSATGPEVASFERTSAPVKVTVTLKGGKEIKGTLVREDSDQVVIDTGSEEVAVRRAETISIAKPKK
jgi:hypothetical protein